MVVAGEEGLFVVLEGAICKGLTDAVDSVDDEMLVMNTSEDFGGDFVGLEQVMKVGARVIFTTFAVAVGH